MKISKLISLSVLTVILLASCATTDSSKNSKGNESAPVISESKKNSRAEETFIKSLEGLNISVTKSPAATSVNRAFNCDYSFNVKDKNGNNLSNFPITISYPSDKAEGEILYIDLDVKTDEDGNYTYKPEIPSFPADTTIAVYPTPINENEAVIDAAVAYRAEADWKVKSDIVTKGAVLFIWDFNEKGRPINNSYDILSEFRNRGMTMVGNAPVNETSYIGKPINTLYKENYEIIEDSYGYLIAGTVKFTKPVEPLDNQYVCSLVAEIQAVNMENGNVVFTSTFNHEATGKNWNACVTKAKEELAEEIVDALVYGL